MVVWSEQERCIIDGIFKGLDYNDIGGKALTRCLIVYPWTQRYFAGFGNLYNAEAILANQKVLDHGAKVLHGVDLALKNMDNIKECYKDLSKLHSEELHVDPDNFKLLSDCLSIVIAAKMGVNFTPEVQAALQKFMGVVVSALSKQYH
ncbi:hemoglobin subunit beta-1-like isoform X1 [Thalassophryne amazonica]|uniref:hemoglobin subunit beta-1-like isoform X1 n=1 Tax=Thalassophryne amazonica TaxID=390379 RepID=UPI001470ACA0|nr:hemoglobin subunit beta-1-like isoform X1 [Thalassophryne amazonica]